jgi:hypothetical protein
MIAQHQMEQRVADLLLQVDLRRKADTRDSRLEYLHIELRRLLALLRQQWPLEPSDAGSFSLGLFAARELEDFFPEFAPDAHYISGRVAECAAEPQSGLKLSS